MRYPVIRQQMVTEGKEQMKMITWEQAAQKVKRIYQSLVQYVTT